MGSKFPVTAKMAAAVTTFEEAPLIRVPPWLHDCATCVVGKKNDKVPSLRGRVGKIGKIIFRTLTFFGGGCRVYATI
nr:hypothetical protein [Salmonid herpesvirus 1]